MNLTAQEKAYFAELAAQIVTTLGKGAIEAFQADPMAVLQAAHDKRQEFAQEMLEGRSDRAKMAHKVLAAQVYVEAVTVSAQQKAIEHCEHIADHAWRKSIGFA